MPRLNYGPPRKPSELSASADKNLIPRDRVPAFMKLIDVMAEKLGSVEAACKYAGIKSGHMHNVRQGVSNISAGTGKKILEAHKRLKAGAT